MAGTCLRRVNAVCRTSLRGACQVFWVVGGQKGRAEVVVGEAAVRQQPTGLDT